MPHTPGPWALSDEDSPLIYGNEGSYIAQVFSRTSTETGNLRSNYAADAALIAAAPDLLEALRTIVANASSMQMDPQWAVKVARAAIAKATV